ncbi:hypothetical protein Q5P01_013220 [Channa striata]|uniref:Uncharacterized protein n=1 Tax=Channa striata TaxID=64152 RepID=A0AA88MMB9_CHASR|nr:hypothetical protein Q5P01_013220 [Channa striata]
MFGHHGHHHHHSHHHHHHDGIGVHVVPGGYPQYPVQQVITQPYVAPVYNPGAPSAGYHTGARICVWVLAPRTWSSPRSSPRSSSSPSSPWSSPLILAWSHA